MRHLLRLLCAGLAITGGTAAMAAQPPDVLPAVISLPAKYGKQDTWFFKHLELPAGKIEHAWTAISATDFVLFINGKEAARSRFGRVPSSFRVAEEAVDLAPFLHGGRNTLVIKSHLWSLGTPQTPATATVRMQGEVKTQGDKPTPIHTDSTWLGSFDAPSTWTRADFQPGDWQKVRANTDPGARLGIRIPKDKKPEIIPDVPPPLGKAVLETLPLLAERSDWGQEVVYRDLAEETQRLRKIVPSDDLAERYAKAICNPSTQMGDSYSITAYPIGNGWVWTSQGSYPFYNTGVVCGPEYQYPVQWQPGSTFAGDNLSITADGKPLNLRNQWMWKIRKTDVVVTAAADPKGQVVFYSVTFAPPGLKALVRIYAVANHSDQVLQNVKVTASIARHAVKPGDPDGLRVQDKTLTESVTHREMKAGPANKRTMIVGALDEAAARASLSPDDNKGLMEVSLGDVAPRRCARQMTYRVFGLTMWDNKPVVSDAPRTLAALKEKNYKLLDETVQYWRQYNAETMHLQAPAVGVGGWQTSSTIRRCSCRPSNLPGQGRSAPCRSSAISGFATPVGRSRVSCGRASLPTPGEPSTTITPPRWPIASC